MDRGALVTFTWRPESCNHSVQIAGTFTSWQPVEMVPPTSSITQPKSGYWTLQRHLEPGIHQYKYVVDGKWVHDDKKDSVDNEMGSKNNVIKIEEYPGKFASVQDQVSNLYFKLKFQAARNCRKVSTKKTTVQA